MAVYTGVSQLDWREVECGQLDRPMIGLRATMVDNILYVTGGLDPDGNSYTSISFWDTSTESWQTAGDLTVARYQHAAVAVPSSIIETECSAMILPNM